MHGTISGGFGGHQVGHIHLLLLPLTNIVPPLLKQQDPALSLSPPPPWWFWCWRLDSLQTNSLFVCLRSPEWKVVRKGRQPDSLLLVPHKVHPEADHIQADLFTSSYISSSLHLLISLEHPFEIFSFCASGPKSRGGKSCGCGWWPWKAPSSCRSTCFPTF